MTVRRKRRGMYPKGNSKSSYVFFSCLVKAVLICLIIVPLEP